MKNSKNKLGEHFKDIVSKIYKKISKDESDIDVDKYLDENEKNEEFEPLVLTLTNRDDLRKLRAFENKHFMKCGGPDFTGAWFKFEIMPTGVGDIWMVSCPCGAYVDLSGDLD